MPVAMRRPEEVVVLSEAVDVARTSCEVQRWGVVLLTPAARAGRLVCDFSPGLRLGLPSRRPLRGLSNWMPSTRVGGIGFAIISAGSRLGQSRCAAARSLLRRRLQRSNQHPLHLGGLLRGSAWDPVILPVFKTGGRPSGQRCVRLARASARPGAPQDVAEARTLQGIACSEGLCEDARHSASSRLRRLWDR